MTYMDKTARKQGEVTISTAGTHVMQRQLWLVAVQLPNHVRLFVTPWDCSTPGLPVPHHLLEFAQVHVH